MSSQLSAASPAEQEEEAARRQEEEEARKLEEAERRKQERKDRRAEMKRQGLILTGKAKKEAERLAAFREQLLASQQNGPNGGEDLACTHACISIDGPCQALAKTACMHRSLVQQLSTKRPATSAALSAGKAGRAFALAAPGLFPLLELLESMPRPSNPFSYWQHDPEVRFAGITWLLMLHPLKHRQARYTPAGMDSPLGCVSGMHAAPGTPTWQPGSCLSL